MIDLHTHILPKTWPSWTAHSGYAGWIELAHQRPGCAKMQATTSTDGATPPRFFREIGDNCWDPQVRMAFMDARGVRMQVLSTVPVMFSTWAKPQDAYDLHRLLNDHIAGVCRENPDRFTGLACLPMHDTDLACRELERVMTELNMRGVQIGTHIGGVNLDEPGPKRILARAAELNASVFVHPWDMLGAEGGDKSRLARYWMPWLVGMPTETTIAIMAILFGGVLDESPNLRCCFAHGGGSFPGTVGRISHGFAACPDLFPPGSKGPSAYLARVGPAGVTPASFWVDALVHDATALRHLIAMFSPSRVCLGTDYPFPLGEQVPGELLASLPEITPNARREILSGAASAFLGI